MALTELFLRLEREVIDDARPNRNLYLITGHSFGGAIVLSALNDILLERVVEATALGFLVMAASRLRPFGHAVILLNPAIEANEVLPLKELVAETCFVRGQNPTHVPHKLLLAHGATNEAFGVAQWLGVNLTWQQVELSRQFDGKRDAVSRVKHRHNPRLETFRPFRTGRIDPVHPIRYAPSGNIVRASGNKKPVSIQQYRAQHIPVRHNDPLLFLYTDEFFITDHNDVFSGNVSAYLAAIVAENRYKQILADDILVLDPTPAPGMPEW